MQAWVKSVYFDVNADIGDSLHVLFLASGLREGKEGQRTSVLGCNYAIISQQICN